MKKRTALLELLSIPNQGGALLERLVIYWNSGNPPKVFREHCEYSWLISSCKSRRNGRVLTFLKSSAYLEHINRTWHLCSGSHTPWTQDAHMLTRKISPCILWMARWSPCPIPNLMDAPLMLLDVSPLFLQHHGSDPQMYPLNLVSAGTTWIHPLSDRHSIYGESGSPSSILQ